MKFIVRSGHLLAQIEKLKIEQSDILSILESFLIDLKGDNLDDNFIKGFKHNFEDIKAKYKSNQALLRALLRTLKLNIILKEFRDFAIPRNRVLTKILNPFSGSEAEGKSAIINMQFYYSFKNNLKCLKNIQLQNYQLL